MNSLYAGYCLLQGYDRTSPSHEGQIGSCPARGADVAGLIAALLTTAALTR